MNTSKALSVGFALPLLFAMLWQGGSCQNSKMDAGGLSDGRVDNLQTGVWGGDRIAMEVTQEGARMEFECANGNVDGRIVLDKSGKFDVRGVYEKDARGPRRGETHSARYTGRVKDKTMSLTINLTDTNENIGTFTLTYGKGPQLTKCV